MTKLCPKTATKVTDKEKQIEKVVRVGVGVVILKDNAILLGERIGSHGSGTWSTPGGHLELGESIEDCAKREVLEETGLAVHTITKLGFTNDIFKEDGKHYITIFVLASCNDAPPQVKEPDKCRQWKWCKLDNLPNPLFLPLTNLLKENPNLKIISSVE